MHLVNSVRSVDIAVTDLAAARVFFAEVWNLVEVAEADGIVYFRAVGNAYYALSLRAAPATGVIRIVLGASDRAAVTEVYARATAASARVDGPPRTLGAPAGGFGFGFQDPEGRNFAVVSEMADHAETLTGGDTPTKISHINLNCRENDASFAFMQKVLGFTLSDQTRLFRFIRCNSDHHSLVLGFSDNAFLNHIAFEMADIDAVMRGIGRMRDHGYAVEWGPGRHGPGNNVFAYFCGPEELPLEYTGEMEQVDDSYRMRRPEEWKWPPGRLDHWGVTAGPSARVKRAQAFFPFSNDGYRLDG